VAQGSRLSCASPTLIQYQTIILRPPNQSVNEEDVAIAKKEMLDDEMM
jgi:hypothetical protein